MMFATASKLAILIAEDHPDTAEMLRRVLTRRGLECQVASSGSDALDRIRDERPCCVILDEAMPGLSGMEVLRYIRSWPEYEDVPVVFYTASFDWKKQMEAGALGAKGWLVKGASRLEELADRVAKLCGYCGGGEA